MCAYTWGLAILRLKHRVLWACSEFRACTQRFLVSINKCSNIRLFSDLMKFTAVNERLVLKQSKVLEKNYNVNILI